MKIKELLEKLLLSFESNKGGFSARKLTSFVVVGLTFILQSQHATDNNIEAITIINWCFVSLLLGLVTAHQIIEFKAGKTEAKQDEQQ